MYDPNPLHIYPANDMLQFSSLLHLMQDCKTRLTLPWTDELPVDQLPLFYITQEVAGKDLVFQKTKVNVDFL